MVLWEHQASCLRNALFGGNSWWNSTLNWLSKDWSLVNDNRFSDWNVLSISSVVFIVELSSSDDVPDDVGEESNHEADQKDEGDVEDGAVAQETLVLTLTTVSLVEIVDKIDSSWNGESEKEDVNDVPDNAESSVSGQEEFNE